MSASYAQEFQHISTIYHKTMIMRMQQIARLQHPGPGIILCTTLDTRNLQKSVKSNLKHDSHIRTRIGSLIARSMGPRWGPSGADRTQVGPMFAPWTSLSGVYCQCGQWYCAKHATQFNILQYQQSNERHISDFILKIFRSQGRAIGWNHTVCPTHPWDLSIEMGPLVLGWSIWLRTVLPC